jgi:hypothetical protein
MQVDITDLQSGAGRFVSKQDLGECAPGATPGHRYRLTAWIKAKGLTSLVAYYRISSGAWVYFAKSPSLGESSDYQRALWITPPMPTEALGISVGASLASPGTLIVDDLFLEDVGPPSSGCATAPRSAPCSELTPVLALGLLLLARQKGARRNRPA